METRTPVQFLCFACLGTVIFFGILLILTHRCFLSLSEQLANQQKELDEHQVILENIFQNSIRIVENSTDVTDLLILSLKKNEEHQSFANFSFHRLKQKYLDRQATYNSAYFVIDPAVQDRRVPFGTQTQPCNTEICWKSKSVPGTKSIHHGFLEFDTVNGRVRVTENGIYNVFTQLTFVDSGESLGNVFKSDLYKNITQLSLNIGQITRTCTNPEVTMIELEQHYITCHIDWTGPILQHELVHVGSMLGQWEIKANETYSFWGIIKLDSWVKDA